MATNIKVAPRLLTSATMRPTSTRTLLQNLQQQQRPSSSAATIALKASTKYPPQKLIKKQSLMARTLSNLEAAQSSIKKQSPIARSLNGLESAQVIQFLRHIEQRKQLRSLRREKFFTGVKYVWKFVEATYLSFTLFVMYMATLDYFTGGEVSKGGKDD
ncbi:hypothetical protein PRZ48_006488 [Zasmidium cellare]|uniref:Uncharacterized protein n=1 Tax=Zasmidium cellare TaxID=395010 RepID=A0ABR0EPK1_ZASCE|nr:hypothetical protein PRZ48_006488 [Zasmidium cellare]